MSEPLEKFRKIVAHIQRVHENGIKLCEELIKESRERFARRVQVEIFKHDLSKLEDFEFSRLSSQKEDEIKVGVEHHRTVNPHHIQFYDDYKQIPEVQLACMACDLKARSEEFGSDVKQYFKKFCADNEITTNTNFYKKVTGFLNLIIEDKFQ